VLDNHGAGRKDHWLSLWTLLGLAIWSDLFCRRSLAMARPSGAVVVSSGT
jgi:hypothetical protein